MAWGDCGCKRTVAGRVGNKQTRHSRSTKNEQMMRLNLGCGLKTDPSWINIDASFSAYLANHRILANILEFCGIIDANWRKWPAGIVVHDIRRGLPYPDGSILAIYISHTIEHMTKKDAVRCLREAHRVMKQGAIIRIVTPDLFQLVNQYRNMPQNADRSDWFIENTGLAPANNPGIVKNIYRGVTGYHNHRWLYDFASMRELLKSVDFKLVSSPQFAGNRMSGIERVEGDAISTLSFCIEAEK